MLGGAAGIAVLGAHGGGRHGGRGLPVVTEPSIESVADTEDIFQLEGDQCGGDMPSEAFDDDPDLLGIDLDILGRHEAEVAG